MNQEFFGTEFFSDEDRAYNGSRFSEVEQALFANPYQRVWGAHGEPPLPVHKVTLGVRGARPPDCCRLTTPTDFGRIAPDGRGVIRAVPSGGNTRR